MITMKVKQYTIHELEAMHQALNIAQGAICTDWNVTSSDDCENCINKKVCSDLTAAAIYCKKEAEERELKYR